MSEVRISHEWFYDRKNMMEGIVGFEQLPRFPLFCCSMVTGFFFRREMPKVLWYLLDRECKARARLIQNSAAVLCLLTEKSKVRARFNHDFLLQCGLLCLLTEKNRNAQSNKVVF